jgi:flagellar assembly protein FliH
MQAGLMDILEVFEFEAGPEPAPQAWNGYDEVDGKGSPGALLHPQQAANLPAQFEKMLAEEARRSLEAGHRRGFEEGRKAEREAQAAAHAAEAEPRMEQLSKLIQAFADARDQYLHSVEQEVVRLSLAVAARILRREAQMDSLLLTGAVRVALGQLSQKTEVRLRVPRSELELWQEAVAHIPNLAIKPLIEAGEDMRTGDCAIETSLGSVDLGVRAQLGEIERGFFDRAGRVDGNPLAHAANTNASNPESGQ